MTISCDGGASISVSDQTTLTMVVWSSSAVHSLDTVTSRTVGGTEYRFDCSNLPLAPSDSQMRVRVSVNMNVTVTVVL